MFDLLQEVLTQQIMRISSCAHPFQIRSFAPHLRRPQSNRTHHSRPNSLQEQPHSGPGRRSLLQSILHTGSAILALGSLQAGGFVSMAAAAESKAAQVCTLVDQQPRLVAYGPLYPCMQAAHKTVTEYDAI